MCCPYHRKDISYASYSPRTFIVIYCMPELWAARVWILSVGSILKYYIISVVSILSQKKTRAAHGLMCCPHHRKDISYASYSPRTFIVIYCMPELWAARVWILSVGLILKYYQFYRKKKPELHMVSCAVPTIEKTSHMLHTVLGRS